MISNPADIDCTCFRLRQASRLVSRTYDRFLSPSGITIGQFGLLLTLAAIEGESISTLASILQMERTTLTRNLSPLTKLGYIEIAEGTDKRARALRLTRTGKKTLTTAKPLWQAAQRSLEESLGKVKVTSLNKTLDMALKGMEA
jgi:DNA-binding MarR family transcriptional regulator